LIALPDTNAYTAVMRGDSAILDALSQAHRILMSSIVVGELEYGFRYGRHYAENRSRLDDWLAESYVIFLPLTRDTTILYGAISRDLRIRGLKIPTNDAWIAAHTQEYRATLWTCDRHFDRVLGLDLARW
jgi:tRNA(fMet)-specific endonuclease VapC